MNIFGGLYVKARQPNTVITAMRKLHKRAGADAALRNRYNFSRHIPGAFWEQMQAS